MRKKEQTGKPADNADAKSKKGIKDLLNRIQANFAFRLFFSLLLAVLTWATINTMYVNPPGSRIISTALTQLNRGVLDSRGIELRTEAIRSYVDIHLKGRQEDLDRLSAGDFDAFIDFFSVEGIENTSLDVELISSRTENVSVVLIEPSVIPVDFEWRTTKFFDIDVQFVGELEDGFYLSGFTRFPTTKSFTARESLINLIGRVEVEADLTGVAGNTVMHQQCRVYSTDGFEMNRLGWEQVVDINLEVSKEVPVIANVTGSAADDYYVRYITTVPETVRINGTKEALEQVENLYTDTLDLRFSRESVSQERALQLPNNVRLSNGALPRALIDVTIHRYQYTQDISLSKNRIELINSHDEFRYEIVENEIPLILRGKIDDIANLDQNQVSAVVDVGGLPIGTHAVATIVTLPDGISSINDVLLNVIIANKQ